MSTEPRAMRELGLQLHSLPAPDPHLAVAGPPSAARWASTVIQFASLVALLTGVYLLAGLGWALVIGGSLVLIGSVLVEYLATRPPRPPAALAPGGDR